MRRAWLVVLLLVPATARADRVLRSYWSADGRSIVSDVQTAGGAVETRLGGSVDGVAMLQVALGQGFVPTVNQSGARLRWAGSRVYVTPDAAGSGDLDGEAELAALDDALATWNQAASGCSYMQFVRKDPEPLEVGLDGKNTVKFREDRWCRPAGDDDPEKCYDDGATAITTLFIVDKAGRPDNGLILDADIEINTVDFAMAVGCESRCVTAGRGPVEDLQNTLTHELGHVLGLDHTCVAPASPPMIDGDGASVPRCDAPGLPASVTDATMYTYQQPRETKKRTPEADDVAGVCARYPTADDPGLYEEVRITPDQGCAAGGRPAGGRTAAIAGLLALVLVLRARACNRSRRP